ncbi:MAG: hypothetical protein HRF50_13855 [Phycisphaerae bacterium]|jgi:hypothetical protein
MLHVVLSAARLSVGVMVLAVVAATAQGQAQAPASQPAEPEPGAPESRPASLPVGEPEPRRWLTLEELAAELGFEASYDRRRVRIDRENPFGIGYRQTTRDYRFEETLGLRGAGALVDERVAHFDFAARWGLSQERFSESRPVRDLREDPHGDVLEYDLNLNLLPRGRISADAFASRNDSRVPRAFLPSLDRSTERYGAELRYNDAVLPMRLSFEHLFDELTSRTRELSDDEERGTDKLEYEATWQINEFHSLRLNYQYEDRRERYSGGDYRFDTVRNYLTLDHALRFGPDHRSSWETVARFQDESGDLARDQAEVNTRLRLQHTDSLSSFYSAQYLREAYQDLKSDTWRGEAGLTHQLADTLTSTLQLYGLRQGADENPDYSEWGGLASAAYSKDNAWGRFSANLTYNRAATDFSDGDRYGTVLNESVTFRDPLNAYLYRTDVRRLSIVVTDVNRRRIYLPGKDYVVLPLGRYTALRRVPTGSIADRETVFVSYTYRLPVDRQIQRDRVDLRIQQDLKFGLTPYYAASFQFEDVDYAQRVPYLERDINRHRLGATYRRPRWSVGLEYEYNDDTTDPYQAAHFNADAVLLNNSWLQLDAKGDLSQFWFRGTGGLSERDSLLVDLGASARALLARDFEATGSAMYRYEDDSTYGITHGVDLTAGLQWRIGLFALSFELEYDVLSLSGSRDDGLSVWLKLKRDIPILATGAP